MKNDYEELVNGLCRHMTIILSDVHSVDIDKPTTAELNETTFTEVEGYSLIVPLRISANPNRIKYTWSKDGAPLIHQNFESTLNITRLDRTDSGIYSCEAFNSMGSSTIEFRVVVLCEFIITITYYSYSAHVVQNLRKY